MNHTTNPPAVRHPDADLLTLSASWWAMELAVDGREDDPPRDWWDAYDRTGTGIARAPARTPQGAAAKLRYLLAALLSDRGPRAILNGSSVPEEALILGVIRDLEAMPIA